MLTVVNRSLRTKLESGDCKFDRLDFINQWPKFFGFMGLSYPKITLENHETSKLGIFISQKEASQTLSYNLYILICFVVIYYCIVKREMNKFKTTLYLICFLAKLPTLFFYNYEYQKKGHLLILLSRLARDS